MILLERSTSIVFSVGDREIAPQQMPPWVRVRIRLLAIFWRQSLKGAIFLVPFLQAQYYPFKRQSHKMVKHTQTIRRQQPTYCLSVFDHFVKLAFKGLLKKTNLNISQIIFWVCHVKYFQYTMSMISCRQSKFNILSFKSNLFDFKHEMLLIRRQLSMEIWYIKIHGPPAPSTTKNDRKF